MAFLLCYCAQCCDPTHGSVLSLLQWSVLGVLFAALTDLRPHHCDIYQYLLLLLPQLLPCWSAFSLLFSSLFLNWHLQFAAFSLAVVAFSFKFHSFSGILRVIPLHLYTVETPLFLLIFHSSLLSTNYLCCLIILFSTRSLPEDKLLASSLHRAGKVLFIQFYSITHVLYESCQYWLFELDYKFLINQCLSTHLFKGVIHIENFCHNSNNNFRHFLFLNCLIKKSRNSPNREVLGSIITNLFTFTLLF